MVSTCGGNGSSWIVRGHKAMDADREVAKAIEGEAVGARADGPRTEGAYEVARSIMVSGDEQVVAVQHVPDAAITGLLQQEVASCGTCLPCAWPLIACPRRAARCYPQYIAGDLARRAKAYESTTYVISSQRVYRHVGQPYEMSLNCQDGIYDGSPHSSASETHANFSMSKVVEIAHTMVGVKGWTWWSKRGDGLKSCES